MSATALRIVEGSSMDKTKALSAALSQIERQFGKGSVMRLGKNDRSMDIETISSGSLGLDIALGVGGLPKGRVVEIYGPESSGKTTLALHTRSRSSIFASPKRLPSRFRNPRVSCRTCNSPRTTSCAGSSSA